MAALLRVDGMTGAGKAYAGGNKGTCSDVYRRGIQNDTVIIDDRQAVGMDVEAIVTVEIRLNAGHGRAGAQQGLQDTAPLFLFVGSGAVVLPAQLLCTVLFLRGGVFIAADVGGRAFHNIQSFLFAGLCIAFQGVFQALECGVESLVISLCRQVLFVLPPVWALTRLVTGPENVSLVWWPLALGEAATLVVALVLYQKRAKKRIDF